MMNQGPIKVKVITVGDSGVGKTSILLRFDGQEFTSEVVPTLGASHVTCRSKHGDREVILQIWDTAGQERFRSMVPMYSRNARVALLVYDISSVRSFDSIPEWVNELKKGTNTDIELFFLIANKVDLKTDRVVNRSMGMKLAEELEAVYLETSAKDGTGVQKVVFKVGELAADKFKPVPESNSVILQPAKKENNKRYKCC